MNQLVPLLLTGAAAGLFVVYLYPAIAGTPAMPGDAVRNAVLIGAAYAAIVPYLAAGV